ncbi:hypothetical protein CDAR_472021 [Caerostris darwini]|uniref:Uncharacterized protein n=1 Tax=Caerostris darwini TaxID=1538125 RepID=A0AAV4VLT2_9ARAC|nr:hypothetical protein CDAR_472021 [Caerostris darwini]
MRGFFFHSPSTESRDDSGFSASPTSEPRRVTGCQCRVHSCDVHSLRNEVAGQLIGGADSIFHPKMRSPAGFFVSFSGSDKMEATQCSCLTMKTENASDFSHVVIPPNGLLGGETHLSSPNTEKEGTRED